MSEACGVLPLFPEVPMSRRLAHPYIAPNLRALQEDVPPGRCLICETTLPESRGNKPRTALCGDVECKRVYDATCAMDSRYRARKLRPQQAKLRMRRGRKRGRAHGEEGQDDRGGDDCE